MCGISSLELAKRAGTHLSRAGYELAEFILRWLCGTGFGIHRHLFGNLWNLFGVKFFWVRYVRYCSVPHQFPGCGCEQVLKKLCCMAL